MRRLDQYNLYTKLKIVLYIIYYVLPVTHSQIFNQQTNNEFHAAMPALRLVYVTRLYHMCAFFTNDFISNDNSGDLEMLKRKVKIFMFVMAYFRIYISSFLFVQSEDLGKIWWKSGLFKEYQNTKLLIQKYLLGPMG